MGIERQPPGLIPSNARTTSSGNGSSKSSAMRALPASNPRGGPTALTDRHRQWRLDRPETAHSSSFQSGSWRHSGYSDCPLWPVGPMVTSQGDAQQRSNRPWAHHPRLSSEPHRKSSRETPRGPPSHTTGHADRVPRRRRRPVARTAAIRCATGGVGRGCRQATPNQPAGGAHLSAGFVAHPPGRHESGRRGQPLPAPCVTPRSRS